MYKDELLHIHQLFLYLMNFLVESGASKSFFKDYINLGISPHHIHRTKTEHKHAIFVLAHGLSNVLAENNETVPKSVANRIGELAKRCQSEITSA